MRRSKFANRTRQRPPDGPGLSFNEPGSAGDSEEQVSAKTVEASAVRLLARREHSSEELTRKLQTKGYPAEIVEGVVAKLRDKRLVSDDRFASSFVHHHAQRGQGPIRIRAELRQQGVSDELIEAQLKDAEFDWSALALAARRRKFGANPPRGALERAKQARFLQYRGFNSDQIRAALKSDMESYDSVTDGDGLDLD